jgi:hypothetical protein
MLFTFTVSLYLAHRESGWTWYPLGYLGSKTLVSLLFQGADWDYHAVFITGNSIIGTFQKFRNPRTIITLICKILLL